jgi:hypothetical protein
MANVWFLRREFSIKLRSLAPALSSEEVLRPVS